MTMYTWQVRTHHVIEYSAAIKTIMKSRIAALIYDGWKKGENGKYFTMVIMLKTPMYLD